MMLPFWDTDASAGEMRRAAELGHRGSVFAAQYEKVALPPLIDDFWEPLLAQAEEIGLSINFHVGFLASKAELKPQTQMLEKIFFTRENSLGLLSNARNVAEVVLTGVCHRYPGLRFVSVENGAGWLPFLWESMEWQRLNVGAHKSFPERLLPGEYLRRQVFAMSWFERASMRAVVEQLGVNLKFETGFPHPTSLSPRPASEWPDPREVMEHSLGGLPDEVVGKVLQHTATAMYGLEPSER
jgi:predicted TIM-barrel fold metal-dependent hydrolase